MWVARTYNGKTAAEKIALLGKRSHVVPVERGIAVEATRIKLRERLGLADSLILATARYMGGCVVTGDPDMRNLKDVVFLGRE